MEKKCGGCKIVKDVSAFGPNKARKDGLQSHCKDCKKVIQAAWYIKNKDRHSANVRSRHKEQVTILRQRVLDYLQHNPCVDCGDADPMMLDFDHVRGEKRTNVADMVCYAFAWETILAEIAKCDVRCVRCHRRRTAQQRGYGRLTLLAF